MVEKSTGSEKNILVKSNNKYNERVDRTKYIYEWRETEIWIEIERP